MTSETPHSLDAERAVLGAAMLDPGALYEAMAALRADSFYRHAHGLIYAAMLALQARGASADFITLREELARRGELDEAGGPAYLSSLVDGLPHGSHVRQHAEIVREKARLRDCMRIAHQLGAEAGAGESLSGAVIDRAFRELSVVAEPSSRGPTTEADAIRSYVAELSAGSHGAPVLSGYVELDELVGGFKPGDLVVVAARPSVGKSSFALGIAQHAAEVASQTGVFFSVEMGERALAARLLAWRTRIPSDRLVRGQATDTEYDRVNEVLGHSIAGEPLRIETHARTVSEIAGWCRRLGQEQHKIAFVVIDYLQLLTPDARRDSREAEVAATVAALKRLAVDQDVVVIALSQLSRASEARRDKRPHLSDLRESGAIEQDCDMALLLFREEMYRPKPENAGIAEAIVAKNRNGPVGVVRLAFIKALAQFANLEREGTLGWGNTGG